MARINAHNHAAAFDRRSFFKGLALTAGATVLGAQALKAARLNTGLTGGLAGVAQAAEQRTTLKLGIVGSIYEDLWAPAKETLADQGIDLEFVDFSDYVTPNNALDAGEIDLNAFQHRVYLAGEVEEKGYKIQNVGNTVIMPLNLFSSKVKSTDELKEGDTVGIPNDTTNGGRALRVLQAAGLVELKDPDTLTPTVDDITNNPKGLVFSELAANTLPSALPDLTAAVINGDYALDFGLDSDQVIFEDTVLDNKEYWNLIAARTEDIENTERFALIQKVVSAFQSDGTLQALHDVFHDYYLPVGWDQDPLKESDGETAGSSSADKTASSSSASAAAAASGASDKK